MKSVFLFTGLSYQQRRLLTTVLLKIYNRQMLLKKKKPTSRPPYQEIDSSSIAITLKPILGVAPRYYVPMVWLIIIMALVFFLLILPGINRNGTWLTVYSDPPDASVIVDDTRLGRTYEPVFVTRGRRELRIRHPGFIDKVITLDIAGRIFASRIFPRRDDIDVTLEPETMTSRLTGGVEEFAAWSATGSKKKRYAIPPTLTILGRDISALNNPAMNPTDAAKAILPMARDARHLADINRLLYLLFSPRTIVNPFHLAAYLGEATQVLEKNSLLPGVLEVAEYADNTLSIRLPPPSAKYARQIYQKARSLNSFTQTIDKGYSFVTIPSIKAPIGDVEIVDSGNYLPRFGAFPVEAVVESFLISLHEVSNDEFAAFVAEQPDWSVDNKASLIQAGLVDDGYLQSWSDSQSAPPRGDNPVTEVSWHAAMAYTAWLTATMFPEGDRMIRLPREDEWEIAARMNGGVENTSELSHALQTVVNADEGEIGLRGMDGNVREWCFNPFRYNENRFRPVSGQPVYPNIESELVSAERTVRGGAYIDSSLPYPIAVRGSLKSHQTSPIIGFRIVIPSR